MLRGVPQPDKLHALVLEYLEKSGRHEAVEALISEADLPPLPRDNYLAERGVLRSKILRGEIEEAVNYVNDLFPRLFDENPELFFMMRLQSFIEFFRKPGYNIEEALNFAREELNPCPESCVEDMEAVMSLILFEDVEKSPLNQIIQSREQVALRLNYIILQSLDANETQLKGLLATSLWSEVYGRTKHSGEAKEATMDKTSAQWNEECNNVFEEFFN